MKQKILTYIQADLLGEKHTVSDDDDLLTTGLVDSIGVMRLLTFIEAELGMVIPPQDVTLENFSNVNAIVLYLRRRDS